MTIYDDYSKYLGTKARATLTNGFVFTGDVISISENSLFMKDKYGQNVTIRLQDILFIVQVTI